MIRAAITGVAAHVPDYILTNAELEHLVDTNDEWIQERTGIKERRILKGENMGVSEMALPAVLELLEKTNTRPEEVELVIFCTVTGDYRFPDTGTLLCYKAGFVNAYGYDISAACSGFLFGLQAGAQYVQAGTHRKVIVVGADKMSSIVDYEDRTTCILFGDGAGAVMLEPHEGDYGIREASLYSDGVGRDDLYMLGSGSVNPASHATVDAKWHAVRQNGRVVYKQAVLGMSGALRSVLEKSGKQVAEIDWLVPHQANLRIIEAISNQLSFPMEKVMVTIQKYGNTTSATIPLCLRDYEQQLRAGDNLIVTAFGGGFTWGAIRIVWAYDPVN